jgi:sulfhydrogenase subunit beta (sulfur reductase)
MTGVKKKIDAPRLLEAAKLKDLFEALARRGYDIIGPTIRDGAIVLDRVHSLEELPAGWTDEQASGHYRLRQCEDRGFFGHAVGPHSWKRFLHPADVKLWSAERSNGTFRILNNETQLEGPLAFFGVRACDLAAIAIQDRVLTDDRYRDPIYCQRRKDSFVVAVNCTEARETCFCASAGTGPPVKQGCDLSFTELTNEKNHCFVVHVGSERGRELLTDFETNPVTAAHLEQETVGIQCATGDQVRRVEFGGTRELLNRNFESPRWEKTAARCLTCANCTMVCPTCFCTTVEDSSNLTGERAERWRRWDSCFSMSFSYIHGGSVRASAKARYRQWLTHKFSTWIDQFGTAGCVGCGRCITWCPVGIDITEELRAVREGENNGNS